MVLSCSLTCRMLSPLLTASPPCFNAIFNIMHARAKIYNTLFLIWFELILFALNAFIVSAELILEAEKISQNNGDQQPEGLKACQ